MSRTFGGTSGVSKIKGPAQTSPTPTYKKPSQKASNIKSPAPKSGQKSTGAPRFKGGSPIKSPAPKMG